MSDMPLIEVGTLQGGRSLLLIEVQNNNETNSGQLPSVVVKNVVKPEGIIDRIHQDL